MNLKHALYRAKFRMAPYLPLSFPVHLDLELAGKCQLACTMCPYGTGDFDESLQGMMSTEMALEAIHQGAQGGARSIKMNFRGEPGLSKDLIPMVETAKAFGFVEVAINTNLTAFSRRRLIDLCDVGLDLMIISIDGATQDTYEAIRVNGDWSKLIRNMHFIHKQPNRPRLRIQMVVQERNSHEVDLFHESFSSLCDELVLQPIRESNQGQRTQCPQPWQRMVIAWDGQVFLCCSNWANENPVGHFPETSLRDIWSNGNARLLRYTAGDPNRGEPCKSCTVGGSYK